MLCIHKILVCNTLGSLWQSELSGFGRLELLRPKPNGELEHIRSSTSFWENSLYPKLPARSHNLHQCKILWHKSQTQCTLPRMLFCAGEGMKCNCQSAHSSELSLYERGLPSIETRQCLFCINGGRKHKPHISRNGNIYSAEKYDTIANAAVVSRVRWVERGSLDNWRKGRTRTS